MFNANVLISLTVLCCCSSLPDQNPSVSFDKEAIDPNVSTTTTVSTSATKTATVKVTTPALTTPTRDVPEGTITTTKWSTEGTRPSTSTTYSTTTTNSNPEVITEEDSPEETTLTTEWLPETNTLPKAPQNRTKPKHRRKTTEPPTKCTPICVCKCNTTKIKARLATRPRKPATTTASTIWTTNGFQSEATELDEETVSTTEWLPKVVRRRSPLRTTTKRRPKPLTKCKPTCTCKCNTTKTRPKKPTRPPMITNSSPEDEQQSETTGLTAEIDSTTEWLPKTTRLKTPPVRRKTTKGTPCRSTCKIIKTKRPPTTRLRRPTTTAYPIITINISIKGEKTTSSAGWPLEITERSRTPRTTTKRSRRTTVPLRCTWKCETTKSASPQEPNIRLQQNQVQYLLQLLNIESQQLAAALKLQLQMQSGKLKQFNYLEKMLQLRT